MVDEMEEVLDAAKAIVSSQMSRDEKLLSLCQLIHANFEHCDWVGFYIAEDEELVLGPYVGSPTEHTRIPFGKGVCGQAAAEKKTRVVDDVCAEDNYLSCSVAVKSEIVVPVLSHEKVVAELDIDSHIPAAFGPAEKLLFEKMCSLLESLF